MSKKRNKQIIIENVLVEDYAAEGKCIAKVDGKVIFIENVVPGDIVNIQLSKNKKDWASAFPLHFLQYSQERVQPFCKHFGDCGGCSWQQLTYEKQLIYKQKQVKDSLERIAKISFPTPFIIKACEETTLYRNKMEYTFSTKRFVPKNEFEKFKEQENKQMPDAAGLHAKGFFDKVVEINTCYLQKEPTNLVRKFIANYARLRNIPFYDIRNHTGWLRTLQIRNTTTNEWMVNVIFGYEDEENRLKLLQLLLEKFPQITTLLYTINEKKNDSIFDLEPVIFYGKGYITEKLEDFEFKISPKSFFQTNSKQAENLYSIIRDFAELNGSQTLYDLYCGTGSIGIFCSKNAKKIIGVELIEDAIKDAKINAEINGIEEAHFFAGDVINICNDDFFLQHGRPDVVITDPPRAGMHEKLIVKLLEMETPIIIYVSCNPATQARDLQLLDEKYAVTKIQPVDMFPHTLHIENIVQLKLKS